jgi:hypothetical protein
MIIVGRAADQIDVRFDRGQALTVCPGDDFVHFGHGFRADAITRQDENVGAGRSHGRSLIYKEKRPRP